MADVVEVVPHIGVTPHVDETPTVVPHRAVIFVLMLLALVGAMWVLDR